MKRIVFTYLQISLLLTIVASGCSTYEKHHIYDGGDKEPFAYPQGNDKILALDPEDTVSRYTDIQTGVTLVEDSNREELIVPEIKSVTCNKLAIATTSNITIDYHDKWVVSGYEFVNKPATGRTKTNLARQEKKEEQTNQINISLLANQSDACPPVIRLKYIELPEQSLMKDSALGLTELKKSEKAKALYKVLIQGQSDESFISTNITFSEDGQLLQGTDDFVQLKKTQVEAIRRVLIEQSQILSLVQILQKSYADDTTATNRTIPMVAVQSTSSGDYLTKPTFMMIRISHNQVRIVQLSSGTTQPYTPELIVVADYPESTTYLPEEIEIIKVNKSMKLTAMLEPKKSIQTKDLI
ncbi:MAG: hypothetical protein J7M38_06195, partial [Armatimonadetes bacterium]|nr:hypothetical protein [Armatimonadota bacterium]